MATGPGTRGTTRRSSPTATTTSPVSQTVTQPHIGTVTLNTVNNMGRAQNPSTGNPGTVRSFQDNILQSQASAERKVSAKNASPL